MHCVKLLRQCLSARDFDRQVAEAQVRVAVLNGLTALGTPITEVAGYVCPGKEEARPLPDLANRASQMTETKPVQVPLLPRGTLRVPPTQTVLRRPDLEID